MSVNTNSSRCVLVTGGSRGIGYACCKVLADAGFTTVSLSRAPAAIPLSSDTHYSVDLSDLSATETVIKTVLKNHPISALICNAGRGDIGSVENFSAEQIQQSLTFNLISPLCIARHCIPALRSKERSDLVFIGSTSGLQGARYGSLYSAAKFGLRGIAQSLNYELSSANCHVGIVQPGMVRTEFFDELDFEPGPEDSHALMADDVANSVATLLQSPDHVMVNEIVLQPKHHVVQKRKR